MSEAQDFLDASLEAMLEFAGSDPRLLPAHPREMAHGGGAFILAPPPPVC
jgi:hypothetical protein